MVDRMPRWGRLFGAHVIRRAQHRAGHAHPHIVKTSGQTKIGQPDFIVTVFEQVGWFDIAVNNVSLMGMR